MDDPTSRPAVAQVAFALGFAGLLPQLAILAAAVIDDRAGYSAIGFAYASLILSFLGGIWWSVALRRRSHQAALLVLSVTASLLPFALLFWGLQRLDFTWPLLGTGVAIMLTLLVDRRLADDGEAPAGWMRLRVPLSLGLGLLSIAIAVVQA